MVVVVEVVMVVVVVGITTIHDGRHHCCPSMQVAGW